MRSAKEFDIAHHVQFTSFTPNTKLIAVSITDANGKKHTNTYYGRGYVQLTWQENYASLGQSLGLGDDLLVNPDNALIPQTAYSMA
jgi:predicted chitinase